MAKAINRKDYPKLRTPGAQSCTEGDGGVIEEKEKRKGKSSWKLL